MTSWRPLEAGEPIGVVALSGPVDPDTLDAGLDVLRSWGHPLELASNLRRRDGYLAGTDTERLEGLLDLLDRRVRLLVSARGGFGATRLLPQLPWARLVADRVRLVGFSDLTAVINPLASAAVQVHGPMAAAGLARPGNAQRLRRVLDGRLLGRPLFRFAPASVVRPGTATGRSVGGNLSLLSALLGTPWEPDLDGSVLFLEEVSEPAYRLDRLLTHLGGSTSFCGVRALVGGSLHRCRPHAACRSVWAARLLEIAPEDVPVVVGLPFGHGATNMAFPVGATVTVDTELGSVEWSG